MAYGGNGAGLDLTRVWLRDATRLPHCAAGSDHGLELPITNTVDRVINHGDNLHDVVTALLARQLAEGLKRATSASLAEQEVEMRYWLLKSEPSSWSWQDQQARGDAGEGWDVRHQASTHEGHGNR